MNIREIRDAIDALWNDCENSDQKDQLNQNDIDSLISCEKVIVIDEFVDKVKLKNELTQKRFTLNLVAKECKDVCFVMNIRISLFAPENSSVVLTLVTQNKNVCLLRCNGPHNEPNSTLHTMHHIHKMTTDDLLNKRLSQPKYRELADYNDIIGAIISFSKICNIPNLHLFLPEELGDMKQVRLEDI